MGRPKGQQTAAGCLLCLQVTPETGRNRWWGIDSKGPMPYEILMGKLVGHHRGRGDVRTYVCT
jgi:hypothetical protein